MKNPLAYQRTEYDCGPTTLLNAVSFLFEREEIPPEVLKFVSIYSTDSYGRRGEHGKGGTSRLAMMFIAGWLDEYGRTTKFPIEAEYISGSGAAGTGAAGGIVTAGSVTAEPGSRITRALQEGGVVIVRVKYEDDHYLLLTGLAERGGAAASVGGSNPDGGVASGGGTSPVIPGSDPESPTASGGGTLVEAWDPYYRVRRYSGEAADIELVTDRPKSCNCVFSLERLNSTGKGFYMMGPPERREAVILYNKNTRKPLPYEPEYNI